MNIRKALALTLSAALVIFCMLQPMLHGQNEINGPAEEPIVIAKREPATNFTFNLDGLPPYTVVFQRSGTNWLEASGGITNLAIWSPNRPLVTRAMTNAGWVTTFSTNDHFEELQAVFEQGVLWGTIARQRNPDINGLKELVAVAQRLLEAGQAQQQQQRK